MFDGSNYKNLIINSRVDVGTGTMYSERECVNTLITLYEKGIIDRKQLLQRMPDGIIKDRDALLAEEETKNEGA